MSISATRKVGSPTSAPRAERAYAAANQHSQFVENIDTRNNVLVRDDSDQSSHHQPYEQPKQPDEDIGISPSVPYVQNSIEALAVSGVFEQEEPSVPETSGHKVSVYDNNQSIIRDEELERTGRNYLKHFYEKNEHLIDVDELI